MRSRNARSSRITGECFDAVVRGHFEDAFDPFEVRTHGIRAGNAQRLQAGHEGQKLLTISCGDLMEGVRNIAFLDVYVLAGDFLVGLRGLGQHLKVERLARRERRGTKGWIVHERWAARRVTVVPVFAPLVSDFDRATTEEDGETEA